MTIKRLEAIKICKNAGINLQHKNVYFSSKNNSADWYWHEPKYESIDEEMWLLANDQFNKKIHVFKIPKSSLNINNHYSRIRSNGDLVLKLYIYYNDLNFQEHKSRICFQQWYFKTVNY